MRTALLTLLLFALSPALAFAVPLENIARGKPYSLEPKPNYSRCTDPDDKNQLTDGEYTRGHFWTQKSTVGWSGARPVVITLDLLEDYPIRGLSYSSAGGVEGVNFPAAILVMVSTNGETYHFLGDLIELSGRKSRPPQPGYAVHKFWTDELKTHGRYVKLLIDPPIPHCFADEIEVYRGDQDWKHLWTSGEGIPDPIAFFENNVTLRGIKRRIRTDLNEARAALQSLDLPGATAERLREQIAAIEKATDSVPAVDHKTFRTVMPLNDLHARVLAIHGAMREARGLPPIVAWGANPWDFLTLTEFPGPAAAQGVRIAAMKGETRAGVLNLASCTQNARTPTVSIEGLPGGRCPAYLKVFEVAWTDTYEGTPVAAGLLEATPSPDGWPITLPAGMTRQVWLSFTPRNLPPGRHEGYVVVSGDGINLRAPLHLQVFNVEFPAETSLLVGGWDYTDRDSIYGVTPGNRAALIAHLRERFVNSPWATASVMPHGEFDAQGNLTRQPDTDRFDAWVARWPGALRYSVCPSVCSGIGGSTIGDPLFDRKVGQWIRFWVAHARGLGIRPNQLALLLLDEPYHHEQDRIIVACAKAIKAVEPEVVIWEDPAYRNPESATPELMAASDVLCPQRPMMLQEGRPFVDFYLGQRNAGRRLELYSCSGPARLLDPYTYYLLQAWSCFQIGAKGSFFWAFGDTGRGNSWNEYIDKITSFTPLFLSPESVAPGKHMEAIRESVADYEYLKMLKSGIERLDNTGPSHSALEGAKTLLRSATERVLTAKGAESLWWKEDKDRSCAETSRVAVGDMLERLQTNE